MTMARLRPDAILGLAIGIVGDCSDAAYLVDGRGTIVAWNTAASELFGIAAWDASARSCAAVVQGCSPAGTPICRAGCPFLKESQPAPPSVEMRIPSGGLGRSRLVNIQHLPIRDPVSSTTIAVLHVVEPQPGG